MSKGGNVKEAIKTYPENIVNHMEMINNCLEYTVLARHLENSAGFVQVMARYDEQGNKFRIIADSVVLAMWEGAKEGAAREMQREGYKQEVVDLEQSNKR